MGAVEIAHALGASRRAVRLYPPEHPAHREAVRDLTAAVNEAVDVRPLALNLHKGRLYEGSEVLTDAAAATKALAAAMEDRRIESLTFHVGFGEVDAAGLSEVLSLRPDRDLDIQAELEARDVRAVTAAELEDASTSEIEERDRRREADRGLYRRAMTAVRGFGAALTGEGTLDPADVSRAVAPLVARVSEDPEAVAALASMTGHGDRSLFHAVAVMLYSLVLGNAVGLSDEELLSLGVAALLHDVGELVASAAADGADARGLHPVLGAQVIGTVSDEDCAAMIVAYEHHVGVDGSGWPERDDAGPLHPYSRIVAVADRYDDLTRPAEGVPARPDVAVARLLADASGGPLDPVFARLLATTLGVFPLGCVVRLADQSVGVVCSPGEDPLRPRIRLVLQPDGAEYRPTVDVDLAQDGRPILEVVDAALVGLTPSDHL